MNRRRNLKTPMMRLIELMYPELGDIRAIMLHFFRKGGTEREAAAMLNVTQQTFNSWKYRLGIDEQIYEIAQELKGEPCSPNSDEEDE